MAFSKDDYNKFTRLYVRHHWLYERKEQLTELIDFCGDRESKDLVFSLLDNFNYLRTDSFNYLLNQMTSYIVNDSGYVEDSTQILALSWDDEADSGQKILDNIKIPIYKMGWRNVKTVNIFGASIKNYKKGKSQILIVDEFIGSGRTLRQRIDYLTKNIPGEFEVKCCFIAGMKDSVAQLREEGIEVFCALELDKGVSGYYQGAELSKAEDLMLNLELKLAQIIKEKELYDYSFGYGGAEALYSLEGASGNTPNSVFPIFWWIKDNKDKHRNTILTRYERGF